jgi:uncharacterized protein
MKKTFFVLVYFLFFLNTLFANPTFPNLSGRVVDTANILSNEEISTLNTLLKNYEDESSNQIVIVTLHSLDGYDISNYSYQLGRYWKIGQKDKNNGLLLLISMSEKKLRIEVGYGLEGSLNDKISHEIIEYILKPKFREGNLYLGISEATKAIIKAIKGEYKKEDYTNISDSSENWFFVYFTFAFISIILMGVIRKKESLFLNKLVHAAMSGGFAGAFAIGIFNSFIISVIAFLTLAIIVFINTKKSVYNPNSTSYTSNNSGFGGHSSNSGSFGGGGASGGW